ncbi:MAG: hypothetical protein Q4A93_06250 [Actinomycetota bacterium]|nr:hypothetical protein [Actinomycetota bacterium]
MAKGKRRSRREYDDDFFSLAAFDDGFDELPHRWDDAPDDPGDAAGSRVPYRADGHDGLENDGGYPSYGSLVIGAEAEGALRSIPSLDSDLSMEAGIPLVPVPPVAAGLTTGYGLLPDIGAEAHAGALVAGGAGDVLENRAPNDEAFLESERAWESSGHRARLAAGDRERTGTRRVRNRLLVVDLLLVLAIVVVFASVAFVAGRNPPRPSVEPFPNPDDLFACCSKVPITTVPNLIALEGDSSEEVLVALGPNASLISASVGEGETGTASRSVAIEREVLIGFVPEQRTSGADYSSARLRLTQDGSGKTRRISYTVSLDDLGYQNLSFAGALADVGFWRSALGSAGIPGHDIMLVQPASIADTRTMGTNALGAEYIARESHTFNGTYGSTALYDWSLEVLYDHTPEAASFRSGDTKRTMTMHIAPHSQD